MSASDDLENLLAGHNSELHEAIRKMPQHRHNSIAAVIASLNGATHLDDLAFLYAMLVEIIDNMDDNPLGWALVTTSKALLSAAHDEGILLPRTDPLAEILELQKQHDHEVWGLRSEIKDLRDQLAERDRNDLERGLLG